LENNFRSSILSSFSIKVENLIYLLPLIATLGDWRIAGLYSLFLFFIFFTNSISNKQSKIRIPFFLSWVFLLLWGVYILQKSMSFYDGCLYYIGTIFIPFIIYVLINNVTIDKKFLNNFFNLFILSGVILSLYSIYVFADSGFDMKQRISSSWQDNNIVSLYLLTLFFFNLSFIVNKDKQDKLLFYLTSLLLLLLGIILTQTRGVYVSMIFAIIIYLIKRPKIVIPSALIVIILVSVFSKVFEDRFLSIRYFGSDVSSLGRLQAWLSTLILLKENLFMGYGFNAYYYLRDQVFSFYFVEVQHPHNTYLRSMLEIGLIGFLFYFSFFFRSIKFVFSKTAPEMEKYRKFIDGLKLTFLGCIPAFMFEPYFSLYGVSTIVLWIYISIAIRLQYMNKIEIQNIKLSAIN